MKNKCKFSLTWKLITLTTLVPFLASGQDNNPLKDYMSGIPSHPSSSKEMKYRMTAIYTNRDLYGNFTGKTKITGDYTTGLGKGYAKWNNVYLSASDKFEEPFDLGKKLAYIENFTYVPSSKMLEPSYFEGFPNSPEAVLAKNMVWDMFTFEKLGLNYGDSLKLNRIYKIRPGDGKFNMADIGNYTHKEIQLCWTGISYLNDQLCYLVEFRAIDNMIELTLPGLNTRGTEQYWGTVWIASGTGLIEHAEMYSGTIQEIEIKGMQDKILAKTVRDLQLYRIQ